MNEFNRKPAHAVPNWQAPASTGKKNSRPSRSHRWRVPTSLGRGRPAPPPWGGGPGTRAWLNPQHPPETPSTARPPLAPAELSWCWRVLAKPARRGRVYGQFHSFIPGVIPHPHHPNGISHMALGDRRSETTTAGSALGCAREMHPRLGLAVRCGDLALSQKTCLFCKGPWEILVPTGGW